MEAKLGSKAQHASRSLNSKGELDARSEASEQSDTDLENDDAADEIDGCVTARRTLTCRHRLVILEGFVASRRHDWTEESCISVCQLRRWRSLQAMLASGYWNVTCHKITHAVGSDSRPY